jgi:outer membrane protein assembly factor BamB
MRFLYCLCLAFLFSCSKGSDQQGSGSDNNKEIVSFSLKRANGMAFSNSELSVTVQGTSVAITVPYNTERNGLIPEITIRGKSISPASGVAQNFTNPITYTVTAENGSTAIYTVTVVLNAAPPALLYAGSSDNNFYALDAATGALKWKYTGTASFVYSSATYANGTVYVGGIDNYVYAFNALTGAILWRHLSATTGIESDAVAVNGTVYVGTNDDYLLALDATTGNEKWRFLTGGNISSSPKVANGTVYFGSSDGKLYALDAAAGTFKWSYTTGAMINQSGAALVNNILYVGSRDGYLYAVDALTGTLHWRFSANGISLEQSSPTISNGLVFIGGWYNVPGFTQKGSLYAVNATTGQLVWEKLTNTGIGSSPCVKNGKLYITGDDTMLWCLDEASGATLWSKQVLANGASAAVANGVVYVGGGGTRFFYAFDANTGAEKWRFPIGLSVSSPLILSGDTAMYSGDSGMLD